MSVSKHTPGPWKLWEPPESSELLNKLFVVHAGDESPSVGPSTVCTTNNEANARLIAAAPELLEACKAVLAVRQRTGITAGDTNELLEAAIRKAEGIRGE